MTSTDVVTGSHSRQPVTAKSGEVAGEQASVPDPKSRTTQQSGICPESRNAANNLATAPALQKQQK